MFIDRQLPGQQSRLFVEEHLAELKAVREARFGVQWR